MSQGKKNSWSDRLRRFVGLGTRQQRAEQSAAPEASDSQTSVQDNPRRAKSG